MKFQSSDRAIKNIMRTLIIFTACIVKTCAQLFPRCCQETRSSEQRYTLICCDRCTLRGKPGFGGISGMFFGVIYHAATFHPTFPYLVQDGPNLTDSSLTATLLHRAATGHLIEIHLNCLAAQKRTRDLFWNHKARRFHCANRCIRRLCCSFVHHSSRSSIPRILQIRNAIV